MNVTAEASTTQVDHRDDVLVLVRDFDAPREQVFDAWTRAEHFLQWFGPKGGTVPHCTIDARVGGELHFNVVVPEVESVWCKGIFREFQRPVRIVFACSFSDENGNIVERPGFPFESVIAVTFAQQGAGTRVTVRHEGLVVDQGEVQGWIDGFDRLDTVLRNPIT